MRVKICGITNEADALHAVRAGADFVGLILAPSVRQVTVETAAQIVTAVRELYAHRETLADTALERHAEPVLVFRDAPLNDVLQAVQRTAVSWVQLHGRESPEYLRGLRAALPNIKLIKAWEIDAPIGTLWEYLEGCRVLGAVPNVVLLDAPKSGEQPGHDRLGVFSLLLVSTHSAARPGEVWCAGGLTPENLTPALDAGGFDGVDVASGVESAPGRKDAAAVEDFIRTARSYRIPALRDGTEHMWCVDCGYILDNLPGFRCPECGTAFDPRLSGTFACGPAPASVFPYLCANLVGVALMGTAAASLHHAFPGSAEFILLSVLFVFGVLIQWAVLACLIRLSYKGTRIRESKLLFLSWAISLGAGPGTCFLCTGCPMIR